MTMATYLVVRTLDVNYAPVPTRHVHAGLDGGAPQLLAVTNQKGVSELRLPPGTSRIEVFLDEKGFWPIVQRLKLHDGTLPTLAWDGAQSVNARNLEAHTRGDDTNVVVNLVLGHLKDAKSKVEEVLSQRGMRPLSITAHHIRDLERELLRPTGRGWDRFRHTVKRDQMPDGQLFFAQRQTAPKLVAIYQPSQRFNTFQNGGRSPADAPIPYHVFFHPSTAKKEFPIKEYPFHTSYISIARRYMLDEQSFAIGKAMIHQQFVSGKRPVLVFPIGSPTESFGSIPRQSDLLRLLQETNYWLQRMAGIDYPAHPVGKCAVSAFSAGGEALQTTLTSTFAPFDEHHLREIYAFDVYSPDDVTGVCANFARWFRRGAADRKLRIYTQDHRWLTQMQAVLPRGTTTTGPSNAIEEQTSSSTLLFDPARRFWNDMGDEAGVRPELGRLDLVPGRISRAELEAAETMKNGFDKLHRSKYFEVHQMHPTLFMTHALKLSSFAD
jgi:hypothetical protein